MNRIFVYKTKDGRFGADFNHEFASRSGSLMKTHRLASEIDVFKLMEAPGDMCPDRIVALCERLLTDGLDSSPTTENVTTLQLKNRGFFGRLKWALFRK